MEVDLVAEMSVYNPFDFFLEPAAERFPFAYDPSLAHELESYQTKGPLTPEFAEYLDKVQRALLGDHQKQLARPPHSEVPIDTHAHGHLPEAGQLPVEAKDDPRPRTIDFLVGINQRVTDDIKYLIRMEAGGADTRGDADDGGAARAATRRGCSASSCGIAGWQRAS